MGKCTCVHCMQILTFAPVSTSWPSTRECWCFQIRMQPRLSRVFKHQTFGFIEKAFEIRFKNDFLPCWGTDYSFNVSWIRFQWSVVVYNRNHSTTPKPTTSISLVEGRNDNTSRIVFIVHRGGSSNPFLKLKHSHNSLTVQCSLETANCSKTEKQAWNPTWNVIYASINSTRVPLSRLQKHHTHTHECMHPCFRAHSMHTIAQTHAHTAAGIHT